MKLWKYVKPLIKNSLTVKAKEKIMEGQTPPFSDSRNKVQDSWKNYGELHRGQTFDAYAKQMHRSKFLAERIKSLEGIDSNEPILEIGCNLGRNLNFLFEQGYSNLHAIEISPEAIDLMKKYYPKLVSKFTIMIGSVEEKIKECKDNQFSITFSLAVLQHIHPDSNFIFEEISRVTSKYIITIEEENNYNPGGTFPRDYSKIFASLGWEMVYNSPMPDRIKIQARIFKKDTH